MTRDLEEKKDHNRNQRPPNLFQRIIYTLHLRFENSPDAYVARRAGYRIVGGWELAGWRLGSETWITFSTLGVRSYRAADNGVDDSPIRRRIPLTVSPSDRRTPSSRRSRRTRSRARGQVNTAAGSAREQTRPSATESPERAWARRERKTREGRQDAHTTRPARKTFRRRCPCVARATYRRRDARVSSAPIVVARPASLFFSPARRKGTTYRLSKLHPSRHVRLIHTPTLSVSLHSTRPDRTTTERETRVDSCSPPTPPSLLRPLLPRAYDRDDGPPCCAIPLAASGAKVWRFVEVPRSIGASYEV